MALKDDFVKGRALRSISAAWLNGVARALNSLSIRFDKNAKRPRIEKPPMPGGRSAWTIVLPPYPEAGEGGGGGEAEPVFGLGPMEYDSSAGVVQQFAGTWSYNSGSGTWTFTKATDADGHTLPAAHVYQAAVAEIMVRRKESSVDTIGTVRTPVIFPTNLGTWLTRQTATVTKSVNYSSPTSEADMGSLTTTDSQITYFEQLGQTIVQNDRVLLTTITEAANETTTYEEA